MARLLFLLLMFVAGAGMAAPAEAPIAFPPLTARVTDLTGTLSTEQQQALEAGLADLEARKGAQVAVLLLPTTQPESIEEFGIRLAEQWRAGRKGVDDGAIVVLAKDDRRVRIEVGYGLEGALNDATARRIIAERMTPRFREGDYFGGLQAGLAAIGAVIEGEALPPPVRRGTADVPAGDGWMAWAFAVVLFASMARRMFGLLGAFGVAGVAGFLAFGAFGLLAALAVGALTFALSFLPPGMFLGGGRFGGGGRGGGFSGGGGGFGGGGASGRW